MLEILDAAAKYGVAPSIIGVLVGVWGYQILIKRGEKDPSNEQDLRARWQAQQDMRDISENVKRSVTLLQEIKTLGERLWNERQQ